MPITEGHAGRRNSETAPPSLQTLTTFARAHQEIGDELGRARAALDGQRFRVPY